MKKDLKITKSPIKTITKSTPESKIKSKKSAAGSPTATGETPTYGYAIIFPDRPAVLSKRTWADRDLAMHIGRVIAQEHPGGKLIGTINYAGQPVSRGPLAIVRPKGEN